jgi:uncharacterized protein (DUF1697 family)
LVQDGAMATHVALLRGINVGGQNKVAMADLRAVVTGLGHTGVVTYIQSGNVVFTDGGTAPAGALAAGLEQAIAATLGVRPRVIVLSREDLAQAVRDNPYADEENPKLVHAVFFPDAPPPDAAALIQAGERRSAERGGRDTAQVVGTTLFVHTPDGFGRSELVLYLLGRPASPFAAGTARNWSTVTKLLALCAAAPS